MSNLIIAPLNAPQADISRLELLERLHSLTAQLEAVKPLYAEMDSLVGELVLRGFESELLADGTHAHLIDNFLDAKTGAPRNVAWKSCAIRRFEINFTDEASAKRLKRSERSEKSKRTKGGSSND